MRPSRIDWSGFIKLKNGENHTLEAAMCRECQTIIRKYSSRKLDLHRNSCEGRREVDEFEEAEDNALDDEEDLSDVTEKIDKNLGMFFFACNVSFRTVENPYFLNFVKSLCNAHFDYKPPCRKTIANSILVKVHKDIILQKKKYLHDTDSILLVDGWRNKSVNRKFLVFSLRSIHIPQAYLMFKDTSLEREDAQNLSEDINAAINYAKEEYGSNVVGIITDNDSKIVSGAREAKTCDGDDLLQSTCSSHSANLLIKSFIRDEMLEIVREIVHVFHEPKMESLLIMLGGTKLKNYPDTRFCYFRDSCDSIVKNFPVLKRVCELDEIDVNERVMHHLFHDDLESRLKDIVTNLDPICKLINSCQNPQCDIADATQHWLSLLLPTDEYDDIIDAKINRALRPVSYAANMLHHKYKGQLLNNQQEQMAIEFLNQNLDEEGVQELDNYIESIDTFERYSENCKNPIIYWAFCGMTFPKLSKLAIKILTIPASTALIESLFSQWTFVHTIYRNRLRSDKSSMLIDIYHSLKYIKMYELDENQMQIRDEE